MDDFEEALLRYNSAQRALAAAEQAYRASEHVGRRKPGGVLRHGFGFAETLALDAARDEVRAAEAALAAARASLPAGRGAKLRPLPSGPRMRHAVRQDGRPERGRPHVAAPVPQPKVQITLRLSPEAVAALREEAERTHTNMIAVAEALIQQHLIDRTNKEDRPEQDGR